MLKFKNFLEEMIIYLNSTDVNSLKKTNEISLLRINENLIRYLIEFILYVGRIVEMRNMSSTKYGVFSKLY